MSAIGYQYPYYYSLIIQDLEKRFKICKDAFKFAPQVIPFPFYEARRLLNNARKAIDIAAETGERIRILIMERINSKVSAIMILKSDCIKAAKMANAAVGILEQSVRFLLIEASSVNDVKRCLDETTNEFLEKVDCFMEDLQDLGTGSERMVKKGIPRNNYYSGGGRRNTADNVAETRRVTKLRSENLEKMKTELSALIAKHERVIKRKSPKTKKNESELTAEFESTKQVVEQKSSETKKSESVLTAECASIKQVAKQKSPLTKESESELTAEFAKERHEVPQKSAETIESEPQKLNDGKVIHNLRLEMLAESSEDYCTEYDDHFCEMFQNMASVRTRVEKTSEVCTGTEFFSEIETLALDGTFASDLNNAKNDSTQLLNDNKPSYERIFSSVYEGGSKVTNQMISVETSDHQNSDSRSEKTAKSMSKREFECQNKVNMISSWLSTVSVDNNATEKRNSQLSNKFFSDLKPGSVHNRISQITSIVESKIAESCASFSSHQADDVSQEDSLDGKKGSTDALTEPNSISQAFRKAFVDDQPSSDVLSKGSTSQAFRKAFVDDQPFSDVLTEDSTSQAFRKAFVDDQPSSDVLSKGSNCDGSQENAEIPELEEDIKTDENTSSYDAESDKYSRKDLNILPPPFESQSSSNEVLFVADLNQLTATGLSFFRVDDQALKDKVAQNPGKYIVLNVSDVIYNDQPPQNRSDNAEATNNSYSETSNRLEVPIEYLNKELEDMKKLQTVTTDENVPLNKEQSDCINTEMDIYLETSSNSFRKSMEDTDKVHDSFQTTLLTRNIECNKLPEIEDDCKITARFDAVFDIFEQNDNHEIEGQEYQNFKYVTSENISNKPNLESSNAQNTVNDLIKTENVETAMFSEDTNTPSTDDSEILQSKVISPSDLISVNVTETVADSGAVSDSSSKSDSDSFSSSETVIDRFKLKTFSSDICENSALDSFQSDAVGDNLAFDSFDSFESVMKNLKLSDAVCDNLALDSIRSQESVLDSSKLSSSSYIVGDNSALDSLSSTIWVIDNLKCSSPSDVVSDNSALDSLSSTNLVIDNLKCSLSSDAVSDNSALNSFSSSESMLHNLKISLPGDVVSDNSALDSFKSQESVNDDSKLSSSSFIGDNSALDSFSSSESVIQNLKFSSSSDTVSDNGAFDRINSPKSIIEKLKLSWSSDASCNSGSDCLSSQESVIDKLKFSSSIDTFSENSTLNADNGKGIVSGMHEKPNAAPESSIELKNSYSQKNIDTEQALTHIPETEKPDMVVRYDNTLKSCSILFESTEVGSEGNSAATESKKIHEN